MCQMRQTNDTKGRKRGSDFIQEIYGRELTSQSPVAVTKSSSTKLWRKSVRRKSDFELTS